MKVLLTLNVSQSGAWKAVKKHPSSNDVEMQINDKICQHCMQNECLPKLILH